MRQYSDSLYIEAAARNRRAIALYQTGRLAEALDAAEAAYALEPANKRLRENVLALRRLQ